MKKLLLLLLVFPLVFASCSDDDDDNGANNATIVGTWKFKEVTTDVKTNSEANDEIISKHLAKTTTQEFGNLTLIFEEGGKVTWNDSKYPDEPSIGTYTYVKNVLTCTWDADEEDIEVYNVDLKDGLLLLDYDYTKELNELELDELLAIGIKDLDFKATKTIATSIYNK